MKNRVKARSEYSGTGTALFSAKQLNPLSVHEMPESGKHGWIIYLPTDVPLE
jgi:hypothetical protein